MDEKIETEINKFLNFKIKKQNLAYNLLENEVERVKLFNGMLER